MDRGPRRLRVGHDLFVDRVHVAEFLDVRQINRNRDNIFHVKARSFDDFLNVLQRCLGLSGNSPRRQFAVFIGALLPGNVERIASYHSLTKR